MHRFFVDAPLQVSGAVSLTGDTAHRIGRVLRMTPGDHLRLFDGSGRAVEAVITGIQRGAVSVTVTEELSPAPAEPRIALVQALIRPNRFEWLVEKATELGATIIQPIVSERCEVRTSEFGAGRLARWRRLAVEAAEQCGRRTLPELRHPTSFASALAAADGLVVFPWEDARDDAPPLGEALRAALAGAVTRPPVSILIGPEGGFSAAEAAAARQQGALIVSLGPRVLRAETAGIAALAITGDVLSGVPGDLRVF